MNDNYLHDGFTVFTVTITIISTIIEFFVRKKCKKVRHPFLIMLAAYITSFAVLLGISLLLEYLGIYRYFSWLPW